MFLKDVTNVSMSCGGLTIKRRKREHFAADEHRHGQFEVNYMLSGERYYFIRDGLYHMAKGDLLIIPPHEIHRFTDAPRPAYEKLQIDIDPEFFPEGEGMFAPNGGLFAPFTEHPSFHRLHEDEQNYVESLLFRMMYEVKERRDRFPWTGTVLLAELLLFAAGRESERDLPTAPPPSPLPEKIADIVKYIKANFREPLTLKDTANRFHFHFAYLSKTFKRSTGFGFIEYVNLLRVQEAQRLLRGTGRSVGDIAADTGFDSMTHFGRVFKQVTGGSPTAYRSRGR